MISRQLIKYYINSGDKNNVIIISTVVSKVGYDNATFHLHVLLIQMPSCWTLQFPVKVSSDFWPVVIKLQWLPDTFTRKWCLEARQRQLFLVYTTVLNKDSFNRNSEGHKIDTLIWQYLGLASHVEARILLEKIAEDGQQNSTLVHNHTFPNQSSFHCRGS